MTIIRFACVDYFELQARNQIKIQLLLNIVFIVFYLLRSFSALSFVIYCLFGLKDFAMVISFLRCVNVRLARVLWLNERECASAENEFFLSLQVIKLLDVAVCFDFYIFIFIFIAFRSFFSSWVLRKPFWFISKLSVLWGNLKL